MKKLFTILAALLFTATLRAQSPDEMSYQAVIRNNSNQLVTNTLVGIKISIMQGLPPSYTAVYWETQTPTTNANGLVSLTIGGTHTGFDTIHWDNGPYFIKTETDPNGGVNYTITGESQLLSVPYALHANTADSVTGILHETDPVYGASPAANITGADITNWNNSLLPLGAYGETLFHNGTGWNNSSNLYNDGFHVDINRLSVLNEFTSLTPILISVPLGMKPLLITSSVKVDSLNADYLDGMHASGFATAGHNHGSGTVNYLSKWTSSTGLGNSIIYDGGSSIGIGTTSTTSKLEVQSSYGVVARFIGEAAMASSGTYVGIRDQTGGVDWYLSEFDNGDFAINQNGGYNRLIIDHNTGNIAIGSGPTTDRLTVNGVIAATGGNSTQWNSAYSWGNHATAGYLTSYTETDPIFGISPAAGITGTNITNWNNNMLPSGLNGQTLMHNGTGWIASSSLFNNGMSVGIGTTSPAQKLDVNGNINAAGNLIAAGINTSGQINSTIPNGIAPIIVVSTTKATNLNADMVDGHHLNGTPIQVRASGIVTGGNYVDIDIPSYYPFELQLSSGHPYAYTAINGGQAAIQGFVNDSRVGLLITYSNGASYTGAPGTGTVSSTYKTCDLGSIVDLFTFGGTSGNIYTVSSMGTSLKLRIRTNTGAIEVYYKLTY
ncbi:MAG TPA: hypothetical protein PLL90_05540 [Bacteroidales bacterium]|nr:hypothetical protein [Bacteroidales bacterium]